MKEKNLEAREDMTPEEKFEKASLFIERVLNVLEEDGMGALVILEKEDEDLSVISNNFSTGALARFITNEFEKDARLFEYSKLYMNMTSEQGKETDDISKPALLKIVAKLCLEDPEFYEECIGSLNAISATSRE